MKKKSLALLVLTAAAFTGTASAVETIRITGSTAFRSSTLNACKNILKPGFVFAYAGGTFTSAGQAIFSGTTKAFAGPPASPETAVIIKLSFSGSTGGLQALTSNADIDTWLVDTTTMSTGGTANAPAVYDGGVTPANITMSDSFQSTTDFKTPTLVTYPVAVQPFQWMRNVGSPNTITSVDVWKVANLLSGGTPLSLLTGNSADALTTVYATGRDASSGTRTVTFADSLFGGTNATCTQYDVIGNPATDMVPFAGNGGHASGGFVAADMNIPGSNNPANPTYGWLIGYAGINDAQSVNASSPVATATATVLAGAVTAVTPGVAGSNYGSGTYLTFSGGGGTGAAATPVINAAGTITGFTVTNGGSGYTSAPTVAIKGGTTLNWNGVPYSADNVRQGRYTFWSYEFLCHRAGYVNLPIANQLANQIDTVDAVSAGILRSTMAVERTVEGGDVTPL